MVDKQKIVVILLLVTIILSVLSVIVTFSFDSSNNVRERATRVIVSGDSDSAGNIQLAVAPSAGSSG